MKNEPATDIKTLSFEQALTELEQIVDRLEKGAETLEVTMRDYERGDALRVRCTQLLNAVEHRIERIQRQDETLGTAPFDDKTLQTIPAKGVPKPFDDSLLDGL